MDAFSLRATLTLDTSEYDAALDKATKELPPLQDEEEKTEKKTNKLGTAFKAAGAAMGVVVTAVSAVSAAMVKAVGDTAEYGDNIDKMSQKMGISAQAYQEWDAVMRHSGTSMETLKASMKTLANAAQTNSDAFKQLGITQEQIASMSQEELFSATITALQNVENQTERTYLASKTLGRGATELGALLNTSAEETQAMKDRVHELGGVMSDEAVKAAAAYQDSLQDMSTAFDGLKRNLVSEFLPAVQTTMDGLTELFAGNSDKGLSLINDGISKFTANLTDKLPDALNTVSSIVLSIGDAIIENTPAIIEAGTNVVLNLASTLTDRLPMIASAGTQAITTLAKSLGQAAPTLAKSAAEAVGEIAKELTSPESMKEILNAGMELVTGLAKGIGEALPVLADAAVDVVTNIIEFVTDPENLMNVVSAAGEIVFSIGEGLVKAVPKIVSAILTIPKKIVEGLFSTDWNETGGDIVSRLADGVIDSYSLFSDAFGGALSIIDSMLGTSLNEWYNDVRDWARKVGSEIYQTLHAEEAAEQARHDEAFNLRYAMVNEYRDALEKYAEDGKAITDSDISRLWDEVYNKYVTDNNTKNLYDKYITNINSDLLTAWAKQAQETIDERKNAFIESGRYIASSVPSSVYEAQKAAIQKSIDEQKEFENTLVTALGDYTDLGVITQIGKELSDEQKEAQSLAKEVYSASQEYVNRQTKYLSLSYEDQISMWEKIKGQFIEGSEQYLDAEEKIFDIRQKAITDQNKQAETAAKNAEKLQKEQTEALEKQLKEQEKAREAYAKNVEKILDEVSDIEKKYVDTLSSRTEEIYNSFGIFDKVPDRLLVSGVDLTNNLKDQIDTIQKFYTDLETLSARGVSSTLVSEIRSMGVDALDELDALLDLSSAELQEYDTLLAQKRELSAGIAEGELEGLRQQTDEQIFDKMTELEALSAETAENLGLTFAEGIAEGIKSGTAEIATAAEEALTVATNTFGSTQATNAVSYQQNTNETTNTAPTTASATKAGYNFTININGIQYQDLTELAQAVSEEIQFTIERTEKGYAGA